MTDPRAVADYLAALTDEEYQAFTLAARDPYRRTRDDLAAVNDQLRQTIARTDRNGRITEGTN